METVPQARPPLWRRLAWSLPWLIFQVFPVLDLVLTPRPAGPGWSSGPCWWPSPSST